MKLIIPFAFLTLVWTVCGLGEKTDTTVDKQSASNTAAKPAQDRDAVKKELIKLANDIATAAKDGDVTFLAKVTTDDFQLTDVDGKVKNKNKALADVKEEKAIKSFDITDEDLVSLDETTGVLSYTLKVYAKNGQSAKAKTIDTYVRRDGKWQLKSEMQTIVK